MRSKIQEDRWYRDAETGWRFKVLKVDEYTLDVVDENGLRRTVNRLICEMDFVLEQEDAK